jgi:hypothetical protein
MLVAVNTECFRTGLLEGLSEIYGRENYTGTGFFFFPPSTLLRFPPASIIPHCSILLDARPMPCNSRQ